METMQIEIVNPAAAKIISGLAELNLIHIKEAKENAGNSQYPYKTQYIKYGNASYILREKIIGIVSFEEGNFIISNSMLDISVWGLTRDDAEEAFAFAFHSLFHDFAKEDDGNLTDGARRLKKKLNHLIQHSQ